jgi:hypothetical protein
MIKIFAKTSSNLSKNANIFTKFFGENILKIITSIQDWANFRLLGDFTSGSFLHITEIAHIIGLLISAVHVMFKF